jgi:hypothetical protein
MRPSQIWEVEIYYLVDSFALMEKPRYFYVPNESSRKLHFILQIVALHFVLYFSKGNLHIMDFKLESRVM